MLSPGSGADRLHGDGIGLVGLDELIGMGAIRGALASPTTSMQKVWRLRRPCASVTTTVAAIVPSCRLSGDQLTQPLLLSMLMPGGAPIEGKLKPVLVRWLNGVDIEFQQAAAGHDLVVDGMELRQLGLIFKSVNR